MPRAVFLDRDGVINRKHPVGGYITRWEDLRIIPGTAQAIAALSGAGFHVIVATNQRCVAKGLLTIAEIESLHHRLCDVLALEAPRIDAVYYCPHDIEPPCSCRKPSPGMLLDAAKAHDIDLASSWMVGDSEGDIRAGHRAGCRTALVGSHDKSNCFPDLMAPSLLEVAIQILQRDLKFRPIVISA